MSAFIALARRDLALALRAGGGGLMGLAFFAMTLTLVPLGVGPEPAVLARIAPGLIFVAAALAALLSLERLFQADYEDGGLDLLWLSPLGGPLIVIAKCLAQWAAAGLPLVIAAPVFALMFHLTGPAIAPLVGALLIATPAFFVIGSLGAALTLGVRRGGLLIALLVLPLYVPFVIFGVAAVDAAQMGHPAAPHLMLLGGLSLLALIFAPLASAAALRISLD